jgi:hypothetical protein
MAEQRATVVDQGKKYDHPEIHPSHDARTFVSTAARSS